MLVPKLDTRLRRRPPAGEPDGHTADWQAGFFPTLLTWKGRRRRVFAAKLIAVAGTATVAVLGRGGGGGGALGYGIALVGRGTAAALGGGLAAVLVIESVLGSNVKPLRPWLVLNNAIVFVKASSRGGDVPRAHGRWPLGHGVGLALAAL